MKVSARLALLFVCCLLVCHQAEAQYLNPKIAEKKVTLRSAVILPAKVEINKESAKGSEMMVAESEQTSKSVSEAVGQTLQQKNIAVLKVHLKASQRQRMRITSTCWPIFKPVTTRCYLSLLISRRTSRKRGSHWATRLCC